MYDISDNWILQITWFHHNIIQVIEENWNKANRQLDKSQWTKITKILTFWKKSQISILEQKMALKL